MDNKLFNQKLYEHNINRTMFTLGTPPNDCMYTVQIRGERYEVYYFERGIKEYTAWFDNQGEALEYLLELLLADSRAKRKS
ncbi:hypothetical protein QUF64_00920 [Anaerolineales bacterium HSG6]|nr:hypothetical protein [Anaerolineales bacterium HSG6]MDM8530487.1 hypothetical protein [Anaerolineales bacterium HSG25]